MPVSNIDELLMGGKTSHQPETPEHQYQEGPEEIEEMEPDETDYAEDEPEVEHMKDADSNSDDEDEREENHTKEYDDYGNEKERMPKGMKDRLDRKDKQHQQEIERREAEINALRAQLANSGASQQVQQATKDFEYDPDASGDWQQQLASFVKQTVSSMNREAEESKSRALEAESQKEFDGRFMNGMKKFDDFVSVIDALPVPIDNPMLLATRAMNDPAAFIYAAAKRHPQELERIAKMRDPYAKMAEMGKLEERMLRNKPTTKAPRPLSRNVDDGGMPAPKKNKETSIEDLIAKSDAKRLSRVKSRRGGMR